MGFWKSKDFRSRVPYASWGRGRGEAGPQGRLPVGEVLQGGRGTACRALGGRLLGRVLGCGVWGTYGG